MLFFLQGKTSHVPDISHIRGRICSWSIPLEETHIDHKMCVLRRLFHYKLITGSVSCTFVYNPLITSTGNSPSYPGQFKEVIFIMSFELWRGWSKVYWLKVLSQWTPTKTKMVLISLLCDLSRHFECLFFEWYSPWSCAYMGSSVSSSVRPQHSHSVEIIGSRWVEQLRERHNNTSDCRIGVHNLIRNENKLFLTKNPKWLSVCERVLVV